MCCNVVCLIKVKVREAKDVYDPEAKEYMVAGPFHTKDEAADHIKSEVVDAPVGMLFGLDVV